MLQPDLSKEEDMIDYDYCTICWTNEIQTGKEPIKDATTFEFPCQHRFCIDCSDSTLRPAILNNQLAKLHCPQDGCRQHIDDQCLCRLFAGDPDLLEKLQRWRARNTDNSNRLFRHCTKPDCHGSMIATNDMVKVVECPICATKVCFKCRDTHHPGKTCQQNLEKLYKKSYGLRKNVSFCPLCRTKIEKIEGCNHMTCGFCQFEFCWICHREATADSDHWSPFSLNGCGVSQLDSRMSP